MATEAAEVPGAAPARRRDRRFLASVRARTTVAAVLIVGLALAVSAVSLLLLVQRSLVRNVDEAAELLAEDIATRAEDGTLVARLPVPGGDKDDDFVIQVVDDAGRVLAASQNFVGREPVSTHRPPVDDDWITTVHGLPVDPDHDFRLVAVRSPTPSGLVTVYVASELEQVKETVDSVRRAVRVGAPTLLALAGLLVWVLVGRALRPVESIRSQVAEISASALDRRVPEPPVDDEVGRLARTMNDMLERLQGSAERQRRFVSDASHELRSPIASTKAQLEVAVAHPEATAWEATVTDLVAENERMERLVTDLLFLARSDEGRAEAASAPVDLDDLVLTEVGSLRNRGRVQVDISRVSGGRVSGDAGHLGRVVRNLLENAERHARSATAVELRSANGEVELVVADDGPGVPPEQRERIFDRFIRLDDARSRERGGAGLGLSIAREIVRAHGGRIWVEDGQDGQTGARFVVRLPAGAE